MANQISVNQGTGNQQITVTSNGNIQVTTSRSVIGTLANVGHANTANTVTNNAQPNITSVGTLTSLTSSGNITAPFFIGNVVGNISGNLVVPGTNTAVLFNQNGNAGASDALKFNYSSNVLTATGNIVANYFIGNGSQLTGITATDANTANYANYAGNAFSVSGANVSGAVAYATTANSVAGSNVSGQVAYAAVANSVAGANVSGTVANATYATSAGTANSATVANSANSVAGANVTGTVANATFATTAGSATTAGTVTTAAQPNITSTGTLTGLSVNGNASVTNLTVTGNLSVGNLYANNANYANFAGEAFNVSGSNVTGYVANATHSNIADVANSVAAANVSGLGNVALLNLDGNASNILYGNGSFSALPTVSNVANANYANFAGTAYNVSGSNVVGDVSGANHSNVADVANSVAGANVTGTVANATYATDAGTSAVANSVAVANVTGIGNIATVNLDGNASNVLLGNGVFSSVPTTTPSLIANGTSNVSIPTVNGNVFITAGGNANIVDIWAQGTFNVKPPAQGPLSAIRIDTYGRSGNTGAQRIASFRYRGNATTPLSVQPGDFTMEILTVGSNGTAAQTSSPAVIRGQVDSSYTANTANIPIGWQIAVNDTNGGVNNQQKTHNFYANGNIQFANTVFVTDNLTVGGNITSNVGVFVGNGSGLSNITGANVTGEVAYAAVANSVAVANVSGIGNIATINLDGNGSNVLLGNGVFSSVPSSTPSAIANGNSNISIATANGNALVSISGNANVITIDGNGSMFITPKAGGYNNFIRMEGFGRSGNVGGQRVAWQRARGNVTTPLSMQPNDILGELLWYGHNGNIYQTSSISRIQSIVDSSYTANTANIPLGIQIQVNDTNGGVNNQIKTHNFYANGAVSFASNVDIPGTLGLVKFKESTYNMGNVSGTVTPDMNNGSIQAMTLTGNITLNSLANIATGGSATLRLQQGTGAPYTLTSTMKFASGFKTLSTGVNAEDIISVFYDGSTYYATLTTGYV